MVDANNTFNQSHKILTIAAIGPDAAKFLQGQLTCDVQALQPGEVFLGAYCNIKGRVESLFYIERRNDDYLLHLHADLLDPTLKELKKYSVFSKVNLDAIITSIPEIATQSEEAAILAKIPQLYINTIAEFFPHDLNLPALGAINFDKGCYRGQEIVARMHYRGKLKRSLQVFNCSDEHAVEPGAVILANEQEVGKVVRNVKNHDGKILGLAVINNAFTNQPLTVNNSALTLL